MKIRRLILFWFAASCAGCNNGSLLGVDPAGEGKLFARVSVQSVQDLSQPFAGGKDKANDLEDAYSIQITHASFVLGQMTFQPESEEAQALGVVKFHEGHEHGEEHEEPTSCDFENSFSSFQYVDLKNGTSFPCVVLGEGVYEGLRFFMHSADETITALDLPEGETASVSIIGTAEKDGVVHDFKLLGSLEQEITVLSENPLMLDAESHHLIIKVDLRSWLHGVDFSQLETVDGVVLFDADHNFHSFEHIVVDHLPESLSLILE